MVPLIPVPYDADSFLTSALMDLVVHPSKLEDLDGTSIGIAL